MLTSPSRSRPEEAASALFVFAHRHDHETLVLTQTRTSGDEVTTDDVLLEAFERIDLTVDSSIVEDLRRFLEGSSRHESSSSAEQRG